MMTVKWLGFIGVAWELKKSQRAIGIALDVELIEKTPELKDHRVKVHQCLPKHFEILISGGPLYLVP